MLRIKLYLAALGALIAAFVVAYTYPKKPLRHTKSSYRVKSIRL